MLLSDRIPACLGLISRFGADTLARMLGCDPNAKPATDARAGGRKDVFLCRFMTRDGKALGVRNLARRDQAALQAFNGALSTESRRRFLPHAYDDATVDRALGRAEAGDDFVLGAFDGERLVGYFFLWRAR